MLGKVKRTHRVTSVFGAGSSPEGARTGPLAIFWPIHLTSLLFNNFWNCPSITTTSTTSYTPYSSFYSFIELSRYYDQQHFLDNITGFWRSQVKVVQKMMELKKKKGGVLLWTLYVKLTLWQRLVSEKTHQTCFWFIHPLMCSCISSKKNVRYLLYAKHCSPIENQIIKIEGQGLLERGWEKEHILKEVGLKTKT